MSHPEPKYDPYNVDLGYYKGSCPFRAIAKKYNMNLTIVYTIADYYIHDRKMPYYFNSLKRLNNKYGLKKRINTHVDIQKAIAQIWSRE